MNDQRPSAGTLTRVAGEVVDVRFVPTEDPAEFLAVTVDGDPVIVEPGDSFLVDVIGPGQRVRFDVSPNAD